MDQKVSRIALKSEIKGLFCKTCTSQPLDEIRDCFGRCSKCQTSKIQTPDAWMSRNVRPWKKSDPFMSRKVRDSVSLVMST